MEGLLFPKHFTDRNEPGQLGYALIAVERRRAVGALGYAVLSKHMSRRATMLTAVLTLGMAMTVIAFVPPLPLILMLSAAVGLVYGPGPALRELDRPGSDGRQRAAPGPRRAMSANSSRELAPTRRQAR